MQPVAEFVAGTDSKELSDPGSRLCQNQPGIVRLQSARTLQTVVLLQSCRWCGVKHAWFSDGWQQATSIMLHWDCTVL